MNKFIVVCVVALLAVSAFAEEVIPDDETYIEPEGEVKYDTPSLPINEDLLRASDPDLLAKYSWKQCVSIGKYGNVCGTVTIKPSVLTIIGTVTWNGHMVYQYKFAANTICATEKDLLELISYVPALEEFKPVIDEVIKVMGHIPAKVFSVCLRLSKIKWVKHHLHACASVHVNLVCWKNKCAWKGSKALGCFKI